MSIEENKQIQQYFSFEDQGSIKLMGGPKSTFSECCHVTYQIKGNEAYNNMLAAVCPYTHTPGPWGGSKVIFS